MRIVFVLNYAVLGGAERQAFQLALGLAGSEGAHVSVCSLTGEGGRAAQLFREHGFAWEPAPLSWKASHREKAQGLLRLGARLRRLRPDLLLPYCAIPDVCTGLVWRGTGAAACVWNQQDVNPVTAVGRRTLRSAIARTPAFAANSTHAAQLVESWGAPAGSVRVIYTGVELSPPQAGPDEWRGRLGLREKDFVVAMLAHLHRFKDHATLLRAWRIVISELAGGPGSPVLLLAGRPAGTEHALKALAFDLDLGRSVRFLGDVEDVSGLLAVCDLAVLSSRAEGCPNGVLEPMAAGLPVAGTDIPGLREPLGAGGDVLLAPPGDAEGLAAAIVRAARDGDLRRSLGERNRTRALSEFGVARAVEARVAHIREVIGTRSAESRRRE